MIDVQGLYDIYGVRGIPFWKTFWFKGVASVFMLSGLVALICVGVRIYRRRKHKPVPYWERAYAELNQLQMQVAFEQNKKLFYTTLTKILKSYLSHYYNESYYSKTDLEVGMSLSRYSVARPIKEQVTTLFYEVTPIKFGRSCDKKVEMYQDIQRAILFIQNTVPPSVR